MLLASNLSITLVVATDNIRLMPQICQRHSKILHIYTVYIRISFFFLAFSCLSLTQPNFGSPFLDFGHQPRQRTAKGRQQTTDNIAPSGNWPRTTPSDLAMASISSLSFLSLLLSLLSLLLLLLSFYYNMYRERSLWLRFFHCLFWYSSSSSFLFLFIFSGSTLG